MKRVGAGFVMILLAVAAFRGRKVIGRFQANVLLQAFDIGEDRQSEIAAGLATVWVAVSVMLVAGGLVIISADLLTR
ncbi:hypothetical protein FJV46_14650 [Arthrobacter agilis]|uniref:hypothetical protein n=2 Tax=Arthrobacter agilis TaxID=37921 RepID=UPI000F7DD01C|nr:hypothetical protein [Arthrobacter agilis]TPV21770.1 hypothetical protein FJV46_14650 [Arthrobacter agilis]